MTEYTRENAIENAKRLLALADSNMQMSMKAVRPELSIATAQACATMAQTFLMLHDRLSPESRSLAGI